jgi:hypothetical protein
MSKWVYLKEIASNGYRLREEIDGGRNHRIVGWTLREDDARNICDQHNATHKPDEPTSTERDK